MHPAAHVTHVEDLEQDPDAKLKVHWQDKLVSAGEHGAGRRPQCSAWRLRSGSHQLPYARRAPSRIPRQSKLQPTLAHATRYFTAAWHGHCSLTYHSRQCTHYTLQFQQFGPEFGGLFSGAMQSSQFQVRLILKLRASQRTCCSCVKLSSVVAVWRVGCSAWQPVLRKCERQMQCHH